LKWIILFCINKLLGYWKFFQTYIVTQNRYFFWILIHCCISQYSLFSGMYNVWNLCCFVFIHTTMKICLFVLIKFSVILKIERKIIGKIKKSWESVVVLTKIDCLPFDAKGMVTVDKELFNKHYEYFMKIIN